MPFTILKTLRSIGPSRKQPIYNPQPLSIKNTLTDKTYPAFLKTIETASDYYIVWKNFYKSILPIDSLTANFDEIYTMAAKNIIENKLEELSPDMLSQLHALFAKHLPTLKKQIKNELAIDPLQVEDVENLNKRQLEANHLLCYLNITSQIFIEKLPKTQKVITAKKQNSILRKIDKLLRAYEKNSLYSQSFINEINKRKQLLPAHEQEIIDKKIKLVELTLAKTRLKQLKDKTFDDYDQIYQCSAQTLQLYNEIESLYFVNNQEKQRWIYNEKASKSADKLTIAENKKIIFELEEKRKQALSNYQKNITNHDKRLELIKKTRELITAHEKLEQFYRSKRQYKKSKFIQNEIYGILKNLAFQLTNTNENRAIKNYTFKKEEAVLFDVTIKKHLELLKNSFFSRDSSKKWLNRPFIGWFKRASTFNQQSFLETLAKMNSHLCEIHKLNDETRYSRIHEVMFDLFNQMSHKEFREFYKQFSKEIPSLITALSRKAEDLTSEESGIMLHLYTLVMHTKEAIEEIAISKKIPVRTPLPAKNLAIHTHAINQACNAIKEENIAAIRLAEPINIERPVYTLAS